jgi:hypothetical protein
MVLQAASIEAAAPWTPFGWAVDPGGARPRAGFRLNGYGSLSGFREPLSGVLAENSMGLRQAVACDGLISLNFKT